MKKKFRRLQYAEVYLSSISARKPIYRITVKLGVPGSDIVLSHVKDSLSQLWKTTFKSTHRYLNQHKNIVISY